MSRVRYSYTVGMRASSGDQRVQDQVALETRLESMNQEQFTAHKARMRADAEALATRLGERAHQPDPIHCDNPQHHQPATFAS